MISRFCSFVFAIGVALTGVALTAVAPSAGQAVSSPEHPISPADSLLLLRADSLLADHQFGPAISLYRSFISRNPNAYWGRFGISRGFLYSGEPDRALPFLNELIHDFPEEADPHVIRGYAYLQLGRIDPALDDFGWVTSRFPNYSDAWTGLGRAYERSGDLRRAVDVYDRWIIAEPENAAAYLARARVRKALGQYAAAEADLASARRFDAPISELREIEAQIATSDWNDELRVAVGYDFNSFGGRRERWETYQAELRYSVQDRGALLFELQRVTRHGLWDRALQGDLFVELWREAHVHTYLLRSLDRVFLPSHDIYVELFQGMQGGLVPSVIFRQMAFPDVRANFYGIGLEKYAAKWLIRTRFSLVDVRERTSPVVQAHIRYFLAEPYDYVALTGGYGQEIVTTDAIGTVHSVSNAAVGAYFQTFFWDHIGIGVGVNYAATDVLPNRGGVMVRLMSRL